MFTLEWNIEKSYKWYRRGSVDEVTVGVWQCKREQIEKWVFQYTQSLGDKMLEKRKAMKNSEYNQTSEALFIYKQLKADG